MHVRQSVVSLPNGKYAAGGSNKKERFYGLKLCSVRNVIENPFGRLKGRFVSLKRVKDVKVDDLSHVIYLW